MIMDLMLAY